MADSTWKGLQNLPDKPPVGESPTGIPSRTPGQCWKDTFAKRLHPSRPRRAGRSLPPGTQPLAHHKLQFAASENGDMLRDRITFLFN